MVIGANVSVIDFARQTARSKPSSDRSQPSFINKGIVPEHRWVFPNSQSLL
jgi:hypothetical protein